MKIYSIVIKKKIKSFKKSLYVDGDKSISHRFFLIASQAFGISGAYGISESEDGTIYITISSQNDAPQVYSTIFNQTLTEDSNGSQLALGLFFIDILLHVTSRAF